MIRHNIIPNMIAREFHLITSNPYDNGFNSS